MPPFCTMWCDELHHHLLVKGRLLIKDASSLVPFDYSYFIYVLIALQNWLRYRLYTPFLFFPNLWIVFCKYKACFQKIGGKDFGPRTTNGKGLGLRKKEIRGTDEEYSEVREGGI